MNLKKILAAIAACAVATSMFATTAFAAGTTVDDETLDDTTDEITDVVEDEEPADEPADEPAPAPNPTTGNSPIALAVIPVALAAAAVVAKKAK